MEYIIKLTAIDNLQAKRCLKEIEEVINKYIVEHKIFKELK